MGKHEKVGSVKKEKIYALRRKLDDFIEEDKKRRDRNLYILERFEKMQSTVTLIKNMNNNTLAENENSVNHLITRNNDRLLMRQDMLNYREKRMDDSNILKEISKKYILIPRIYSLNRYPVVDIKHSEDVDWRSKYKILEELKKKERTEPPERDMAEHCMQKDSGPRKSNNLKTNDSNINSQPLNKGKYNIQPNKNISSNYKVWDEPDTSLLESNDWKSEARKIDDCLDLQNDDKSIHDSKHTESNLDIDKGSKCIAEDQIDMPEGITMPEDNPSKIFKYTEMSKNAQDANAQVIEEIQLDKQSYPNKENDCNIKKDDSNNGTQQLSSHILPELEANDTHLDKTEPIEKESCYSENVDQNVDNNETHQYETPQIYENDISFPNDQFHNNYEETQLQEQSELYDNVSQESPEIAEGNSQNYEQEQVVESQINNEYHSENYENYEAENPNYEYQNVGQQNFEYNSSNNELLSEPAQETNSNFNENVQNYESEIELNQQQIMYDQQNFIDPDNYEIQQTHIDTNEVVQKNNISENSPADTTGHEETNALQHEYDALNHGETDQQFPVDHYSSVQNESDTLEHDYNNQNYSEMYQDNPAVQQVPYDYAAQGQEIQQHDDLAYNDQNQGEYGQYNEDNALNPQNESENLQENYDNQNTYGISQDGTLNAQDIQENVQYDYNPESNEMQQNYVNDSRVSQENYVES